MNRFLLNTKASDGTYSSPEEAAAVIRALTAYLESTGELKNVDMNSRIKSNAATIAEQKISGADRFAVYSKNLAVSGLPNNSTITFEKEGKGTLYYDLSLVYTVPSKDIAARDEGFYVDTNYYLLSDYQKIRTLKNEEWDRYEQGEISYGELKYPKDIVNYLTPKTSFHVGDLVYVHNRLIANEARMRPAFEGFIPAGSELVNTIFSTETKDVVNSNVTYVQDPYAPPSAVDLSAQSQVESDYSYSKLFDHEEYRDDRYFATANTLEA